MRVAIGSDHRGYELKNALASHVKSLGHECVDLGCPDQNSVDYPDMALKVADAVSRGQCERGVLICGTGIGMSMSANKVKGVRAALCHDLLTSRRAREHNDANVLCVGADVVERAVAEAMVGLFLATEFEGGRHARRVEQMSRMDERDYS